ncbi:nucleotidyltransferase family protein, partial [Robiginitalea biformata]|uniref:nucleotidyltransferase family protein n=1 Tax=Robiginitalea biformata TaxID=252307 RepID=UPI003D32B7FD
LKTEPEAVIILLGDMPRITPEALNRLIVAYRESSSNLIVAATADGKRGNPVLWDQRFFDALKSLTGDIGARHVIAENP